MLRLEYKRNGKISSKNWLDQWRRDVAVSGQNNSPLVNDREHQSIQIVAHRDQ